MTTHIEVNRRFYQLSEEDLKEAELYASYPEFGLRDSLSWEDLTMESRVLILAEGGSGKTREMQRQVENINDSGRSAFFLPLESLSAVSADRLLDRDGRFSVWKAGNSPGWFFLDSVDELKLTPTKFANALDWFASALGTSLHRARIVISSRPHDWQASVDLGHFRHWLPLPPSLPAELMQSADEIFRAALQRNQDPPQKVEPESKFKGPSDVRVVMLAPLNNDQIRFFASACGVQNTEAFLKDVEHQNVWEFARRPLDLGDLVNIWRNSKGSFGTKAEQLEANVVHKLRDNPNRKDTGHLADNKARQGVERLALAMCLTRRWNLHSYEATVSAVQEADDLDPAQILDEWSQEERKALLGRAIFQPSTYGRIRFHNRSVQEYLAACCLNGLRKRGMTMSALFRMMFAETYGTKVVIPSMRAVAAWLALRDNGVRTEILRRQPELLLQEGDPGSLDLPTRRVLLSSYVASYGRGSFRGISVSHDEIRRLSDVELGPEISRIWGTGIENEEVKDLLISLVEAGKITSCSKIAAGVIHDPKASSHSKLGALHALIACADDGELATLGIAIRNPSLEWKEGFLQGAMLLLFPRYLSAGELVELTGKAGRRRSMFSSEGLHFLHHLQSTDLSLQCAAEPLRSYRLQSDFSHLTGSLIHVCLRQIRTASPSSVEEIIGFLVIASRFRDETSHDSDYFAQACDFVGDSPAIRRIVFECDYRFITGLLPDDDPRRLILASSHQRLTGNLVAADAAWLDELLRSEPDIKLKAVACEIALRLWRQGGEDKGRLEELRMISAGQPELEALLASYEFPSPSDPTLVKIERDHQRYLRKHQKEESRRLRKWEEWREAVNGSPADSFADAKVVNTIENLHKWLMGFDRSMKYGGIWNREAIIAVFGEDFLHRAEQAFQKWWRQTTPELPSCKEAELKNKTPYAWLCGLTGVESESARPGWAESLSEDEAMLATTLATVEINGLASYLTVLARSRPEIVKRTLGMELEKEFESFGNEAHLQVLQDLTHAERFLQDLMTPCLLRLLLAMDGQAVATQGNQTVHNLDQLLRVLRTTADGAQKALIGKKCHSEYLKLRSDSSARAWFKGVLTFAPQLALPILERDLREGSETVHGEATKRLAELFGDHGGRLPIPDDDERAATLGRLIRLAYEVRTPAEATDVDDTSEDDEPRNTVGSARANLLGALMEITGRAAQDEVRLLATEPKLSDQSDRLLYLAREKAAKDSEPPASSPNEVRILQTRNELPPEDQAGLFQLMIDRLDDLAHEIAHHDFSDRATLRTVTEEVEMQRALAFRLEKAANDCYTITREAEMADLKRNDIQLSIQRNNVHVVIEVKLADNNDWSASDFKRFLITQLKGQYLRHKNCTAGCLLLVYRGSKKFWHHPQTKARMGFDDLVAYLRECIDEELRGKITSLRLDLAVVGLDLRDPELLPAHRPSPAEGATNIK